MKHDNTERQNASPERLPDTAACKSRIIEELQALGRQYISTGSPYCKPVLEEIQACLETVLHNVEAHVHNPFSPLKLATGKDEAFMLAGRLVTLDGLATKERVLSTLRSRGASFAGLEPIRNLYEKRYGDDLCWTFPYCDGKHLGGVILPVQEGFLYLPYDGLDSEDYELFSLVDAKLLTEEMVRFIAVEVEAHSALLYSALLDIYQRVPPEKAE